MPDFIRNPYFEPYEVKGPKTTTGSMPSYNEASERFSDEMKAEAVQLPPEARVHSNPAGTQFYVYCQTCQYRSTQHQSKANREALRNAHNVTYHGWDSEVMR